MSDSDDEFDPIYLAQVKDDWFRARREMRTAHVAISVAKNKWYDAISREMETANRMKEIFKKAGKPMPKAED
jgi:hypothetical protein